jgi:ligand-binding sensor domain-containing protein/GAF domain-containing protein
MKKTCSLTIILIFFFIFSYSQNQQIYFDHLTADQGLSQGTVNCIYQDHIGFMWFGTKDGLNRYDGYTIKVYKNDTNDPNSLSDNYISAIAEDSKGRLWIGTWSGGINVYDRDKEIFTRYQNKPSDSTSLSKNRVREIFINSHDSIWIGTLGGGINLFIENKNCFRSFTVKNSGLSNNDVYSIIEDTTGILWVGTDGKSVDLFNFNRNEFQQINVFEKSYKSSSRLFGKSLFKDSKNNIWLGTEGNGVFRFDRKSKKFLQLGSGSKSIIISSIIEDRKGNIWIGEDGGGINIYNPFNNSSQYLNNEAVNKYCLSSNSVYSIFEDNTGTIWIGTYGGGLNIFNEYKYKFKNFTQTDVLKNSLGFKSVLAIYQDNEDRIWIGTDGGGLDLFDRTSEKFKNFKFDPKESSNVVKSIFEDNRGNLWLGTFNKGLFLFDRKNKKFTSYINNPNDTHSIGHNNVWTIYEDKTNNLWIGLMGGGLDRFNWETKKFFHHTFKEGETNRISSNNVKTIFEDSGGNLWVGTEDKGLNLFDRESGKFTYYPHIENDTSSISNNDIRVIYQDNKGKLWFGTADGLCRFNKETKNFYTIRRNNSLPDNSLPDNVINGILDDSLGSLWISTNKGISKYNPDSNTFRNFDFNDGLQGNEFNNSSQLKSKNGEMFFGGVNGFNSFYPGEIKDNDSLPLAIITDFKLFGKSVNPNDTIHGRIILEQPIFKTIEINLKYNENMFSFEFSALQFIAPLKNKYAYMLEGFDEDWKYVGSSNRLATYSNLDPGDYIFKVKASNSDGLWNNIITSTSIKINEPWWWKILKNKLLFFAVLISIILLIIVLLLYLRIRNYWAHKKQFEENEIRLNNEVEKHTAELEYLNKAGQELTSSIQLSVDNIIERIYSYANDLIRIKNMYIALYDQDTGLIRFGLAVENGIWLELGKGKWESRNINDESRGKTTEVIANKKPLVINSLEEHQKWYVRPGYKTFEPSAHSWLGVPIQVRDSILGMIAIYDLEFDNKYTEQDLKFMSTLATQAAIALENARLFQESKNRTKLLEIAAEVGKDIGGSFSKKEIFSELAERVQNQLKCNHCSIFYPNKNNEYLILHTTDNSKENKQKRLKFNFGEGLVGRAYELGESILSENVYENEYFKMTNSKKGPFRSMLIVPIKSGNLTVAVICADIDVYNFFTISDRYFLEVLARQVGFIIDRINGLVELQKIGNRILNLEKTTKGSLLKRILTGAIKLLNATTGVIYLLSKDEKSVIETYYLENGFEHPKPRLNIKESLTRQIIESRKVILIKDINNDTRVNPILIGHCKSMIGVPLILKDKVVGVLYLNDKNSKEYNATEISLLQTLVGQATIAIVNVSLVEDISRKANALQAIYEAGKAVTSMLSSNNIIEKIVTQVHAQVKKKSIRTGKDELLIHLGLVKGNKIEYKTWVPNTQMGFTGIDRVIDLEKDIQIGIMGRCVKTGHSILVDNVSTHKDYILTDENTQSELAVLIKLGKKIIGIINVEHPDLKAFDSEDQDFLEHLAAHAAIALNNALLFNKIQEITKTYPSISELNTSVETVLNKIAKVTQNVLEADIIVLYRYDNRKKQVLWPPIKSGNILNSQNKNVEIGHSDAPYRIINLEHSHYTSDSANDKIMNSSLASKNKHSFVKIQNIFSSAGVLLKVSDNIVGVLFINYRIHHEFDENEKQIIELYSSYVALAIQNVLHFRDKEVADASKTLGELTGRFAHKMKNDLASMRLYLDALLKNCRIDDDNNYPLIETSHILNGLTKSINHLLELSKLKTIDKVEVNIQNLIEEFLNEISSKTISSNVELERSYGNNLSNLYLDPGQTKIVLSNLAENSFQCMENGGKIVIKVFQERETIFIEWSDSGPGINEQIKDKIFEMAYTTKQYGYGLGLFHSRAIIEEYGGTLILDTSFRNGAKFIIRLPIK